MLSNVVAVQPVSVQADTVPDGQCCKRSGVHQQASSGAYASVCAVTSRKSAGRQVISSGG